MAPPSNWEIEVENILSEAAMAYKATGEAVTNLLDALDPDSVLLFQDDTGQTHNIATRSNFPAPVAEALSKHAEVPNEAASKLAAIIGAKCNGADEAYDLLDVLHEHKWGLLNPSLGDVLYARTLEILQEFAADGGFHGR
jgi:hypothetical protein